MPANILEREEMQEREARARSLSRELRERTIVTQAKTQEEEGQRAFDEQSSLANQAKTLSQPGQHLEEFELFVKAVKTAEARPLHEMPEIKKMLARWELTQKLTTKGRERIGELRQLESEIKWPKKAIVEVNGSEMTINGHTVKYLTLLGAIRRKFLEATRR